MKDLYEKKLKAAEYRMERSDKFWHNCLDEISSLKRRNRDLYRENRCLSKEKRQAVIRYGCVWCGSFISKVITRDHLFER